MAIAVGNTSSGSSGATTLTISHTVASGSDRLLIVATNTLQSPVPTYTGVTYNGVAMTKIDEVHSPTPLHRVALWYLLAPDVGTANIVVTVSATPVWLRAANADYTGVAQQAYESSAKIDQNTATPANVAVTLSPTTANSWFFGSADAGSATITASTNSYVRVSATNQEPSLMDSNAAIAGTGNTTFAFDAGTGVSWEHFVAASFAPASAGGPTNLKSLDTNVKANIKSYNTNVIANIKSINTNA